MKRYLKLVGITAIALLFQLVTLAQNNSERVVVNWRDSSRPGTLDLNSNFGSVTVTAFAGKDVVIEARPAANSASRGGRGGRGGRAGAANDAGLIRIPKPLEITADERNNVITLALPADAVDLNIQVPVRTNLKVNKVGGGAVTIQGVDGDLEISTAAGPIRLIDVAGSVVAHSMAGDIIASVTRVTPDRPMAFTAFAGSVDVTLPATIKANVILANHQGSVTTDFDVQRSVRVPAGAGNLDAGTSEPSIRGTLNGGGPDVELRSFAGNLYLRKSK